MMKSGLKAVRPELVYEPDLLVWHPEMFRIWDVDNFRVNYFVSVVGDDQAITSARKSIASVKNEHGANYYRECQLTPCVFKKVKKSHKSRLVDINLAVEAMRMAYSDQVDVICIISGDGDFTEVYNDIKRRGKQVCVAALSDGLNPEVPLCVDRFIDLDTHLFTNRCSLDHQDFHQSIAEKIKNC